MFLSLFMYKNAFYSTCLIVNDAQIEDINKS